MQRLILRLQAVFLATVFVAGSFGLPEADVLLDHRLDHPVSQTQTHIEGAGGCTDHSDHCVLGRLLTDLRHLAPASPSSSTIPPATGSALGTATDRFTPQRLDLSYRSRAPPTLG